MLKYSCALTVPTFPLRGTPTVDSCVPSPVRGRFCGQIGATNPQKRPLTPILPHQGTLLWTKWLQQSHETLSRSKLLTRPWVLSTGSGFGGDLSTDSSSYSSDACGIAMVMVSAGRYVSMGGW